MSLPLDERVLLGHDLFLFVRRHKAFRNSYLAP